MMTCLMEMTDSKGEKDNFPIKIQSYMSTVRLLSGLYQKLYKGNESERKTLEQLKDSLDTLHLKMLRDQEVLETSEESETLSEVSDISGTVSKPVKRPRKGKSLS